MSPTNNELIALLRSPARLRTLSDAELMAALCAGCNDALAVLFERHSTLVFHTARGILRDDGAPEEQPEVIPPRRRELVIEILKFLTPAVALVSSLVALTWKYPWLTKPWIFDPVVVLGIFVLVGAAKPRLRLWLQRIRRDRSDQRFIAANRARLQELLEQLAVFISSGNNRSLLYILRCAHLQNMRAVEPILVGGSVAAWLQCYRQQLTLPTASFHQFLNICMEFSRIVQEFNANYVLRNQMQLANVTPLAEHFIVQLEEFREEYNAFLRDVEHWAKGVSNYLQVCGAAEHSSLWRLAPADYFERAKSFRCESRKGQRKAPGV